MAWLHCVAFVDEDALDYAAVNRADHAAFGGDDGGIGADAHGPGHNDQEGDGDCGASRVELPAAARHGGEKFLFSLRERLQEIGERDLLVELRVANGDGGLVGEDGDGFFVVVGEKIGIAAEQGENAEGALIVAERQRVKSIFFAFFEKRDDLGVGFLRLDVPAVVVQIR